MDSSGLNSDSAFSLNSVKFGFTIRRYLLLKRRAANRGKKKHDTNITVFSTVGLGIITIVLAVILVVAGYVSGKVFKDLPDIHQLPAMAGQGGSLYKTTLYYDRTGKNLITGIQSPGTNREYYPLSSDGEAQNSILLADYVEALLEQSTRSSGSSATNLSAQSEPITIAERLVTELLLSTEKPSFTRTVRMKILATQAIANYGNRTLLEWFLNTASYGHAIYGFGQASKRYFNKNINQLNPGEVLILAVSLQDPSINPVDSPDLFDGSLQQAGSYMLRRKSINSSVLDQASKAVAENQQQRDQIIDDNPAFLHYVHEQLSVALGSAIAERGGLIVTTTMDYDLQMKLECAVKFLFSSKPEEKGCNDILGSFSPPIISIEKAEGLQVNFVVLDPLSGQVLALIGDFSGETGQQDYLQAHPSGSLLTPFIYLAGMLHGMGPATLVWDTPTNIDDTIAEKYYLTHEYKGPMRLRVAVSEDHLAPATKVLEMQGEENVISLMSGFGLHLFATEGIPYDSGITDSLSIAQAFSVFANGGNKAGQLINKNTGILSPTTILTVNDNGRNTELDWGIPEQQAVISPALAFLMNDMLASSDAGKFRGSIKQGTTISGSDYLKVAYNPDYVFALWVGQADNPGGRSLQELGIDTLLINILDEHFRDDSQFSNWQPPMGVSTVKVCDPSGKIAGEGCPQTVTEYFLAGNEPTELDTLYEQYSIDSETGRLATIFTDPTRIVQRVFFNAPPEEVAWAREAGYSLPPDRYAVFQFGNPIGGIHIDTPQDFDSIRGIIEIKGGISSMGFVSYRLAIGSGLVPMKWLQIGDTHTEFSANNVLGSLDTRKLQNGLYTLRIQVVQEGNVVDNAYVVVLIDNPQ